MWSADQLDAAVRHGASVSLNEALGWLDNAPQEPPGRNVVITGLETALDQLALEEAEEVLRQVHRLIRRLQTVWESCGITFAVREGGFYEASPNGPIMVRLRNGKVLDIGRSLWSGAAMDAKRIMSTRIDPKRGETEAHSGYWLVRVS